MRRAKHKSSEESEENEMREEYDFSGGVRGKHFRAYRQGHTVKIARADGSTEEHYFTQEDGAVIIDPAIPVM